MANIPEKQWRKKKISKITIDQLFCHMPTPSRKPVTTIHYRDWTKINPFKSRTCFSANVPQVSTVESVRQLHYCLVICCNKKNINKQRTGKYELNKSLRTTKIKTHYERTVNETTFFISQNSVFPMIFVRATYINESEKNSRSVRCKNNLRDLSARADGYKICVRKRYVRKRTVGKPN